MKKKIICIALSALVCTSLIACKNTSKNITSNQPDANTEEDSENKDNKTTNTDNKDIDNNNKTDTSSKNDNESKSEKKDLRIFYYDIEKDKIIYQTKKVEITDGALVNAIINCYKGSLDNQCYSGLPDDITVKSAKKDNDILTVNFGDKFVNNLGYGAGIEGQILQSIVNSLGYNFNVSKVYITVDGKPYASGHIISNENEPFSVNYTNCIAE